MYNTTSVSLNFSQNLNGASLVPYFVTCISARFDFVCTVNTLLTRYYTHASRLIYLYPSH